MKKMNAAQVLSKYLWRTDKAEKLTTQQDVLSLLMDFQKFLYDNQPNLKTDWDPETIKLMEANGDNPKDFPYNP